MRKLLSVLFTFGLLMGATNTSVLADTLADIAMWADQNSDSSKQTLNLFWVDGRAPWDVGSLKINGPDGYERVEYIYDNNNNRYNVYYNHYFQDMKYVVSASGEAPLTVGDYTYELRDHDGTPFTPTIDIEGFLYNELDIVDISTANPANEGYTGTVIPTLSWTAVTGEPTTPYYRVVIREYHDEDQVVVYASDRSISTSALIPADILDPNTAYKWRVEVFDADSKAAHNRSKSDWSAFSTGSATPSGEFVMDVDFAYMRSRIKHNGSFRTQMGIGFTGPAPWDVSVEVEGPASETYTMNSSSYWQDGYYYQVAEQLTDGNYTFTVTDLRDNVEYTETRTLTANWAQQVPSEDMMYPENKQYFDTEEPTFSWDPVAGQSYWYRVKVFSFDWQTVWTSDLTQATVVTVPAGELKRNNAYRWRIESYDGTLSNRGNRRDSANNKFFIANDNAPANISGTISPGVSGAGGPIFIMVTDGPNLMTSEDYGFTMIAEPGAYTIYNVPRTTDMYVHVVYDDDNSDTYTVGDWTGVYGAPTAVNLPLTGAVLTGYDVTLSTEVFATTVKGTVTCANYTGSRPINIAAYDEEYNIYGDNTAISQTSIAAPGDPYTLDNMPIGGEAYIYAAWDIDESPLDRYGEHPSNPILISSPGNTGVDIDIVTIGYIAGTVTAGGSALENIHVYATDYDTGQWVAGVNTNSQGQYALSLSDGDYNVWACPGCSNQPYGNADAQNVSVGDPLTTVQDFALENAYLLSGTVTDGTNGIDDACVSIESGKCNGGGVAWGHTQSDGTYDIYVAPGTYYINTNADCNGDSPQNNMFLDKYYDGVNGTENCNNATSVTVGTAPVPGINFSLAVGGTISGTVVATDGGAPLQDIEVYVTNSISGEWLDGMHTDSQGQYVFALGTGTYNVWACPECVNKPYGNSNAQGVSVTVPEATVQNFSLDNAYLLTGFVTDGTDGIENVCVHVESGPCHAGYVASGKTMADGMYQVYVPTGTYYLNTNANCNGDSPQNSTFINQYYDGVSESDNCNGATPVTMGTAPVGGIDFLLTEGGSVSGIVFDSVGNPIVDYGWNHNIGVEILSGTCDNLQYVARANIDDTHGDFVSPGLAPGQYFLKAVMSDTPYIDEYWTESGSQFTCDDTEKVQINLGSNNGGNNFHLDDAFTITGTVSDSETPSNVLANFQVVALDSEGKSVTYAITNDGGFYTLRLPGGIYFVEACTGCNTGSGSFPFVREYWDDVTDFGDAEEIDITLNNAEFIDFYLSAGASISGTLRDELTTLAITGSTDMRVEAFTGDPCGDRGSVTTGDVDTNGQFTVSNLPPGDYKLATNTNCNDFYINGKHFTGTPSDPNCDATPVNVIAGGAVSGKDISLSKGGKISGFVKTLDGSSGIDYLSISIFKETGEWVGGSGTHPDGYYCVTFPATSVPEDFTIQACPSCGGPSGPMPFIDEYYDDKFTFDTADTVSVTLNNEVAQRNFLLAAIIPGDITGDEIVDLTDLIKGLQILAGDTPSGNIFSTGDVNGDDDIGMADLIYIMNNVE